MRVEGFEPSQALSHESLSLARLTTPAYPHENKGFSQYKKFYNSLLLNMIKLDRYYSFHIHKPILFGG